MSVYLSIKARDTNEIILKSTRSKKIHHQNIDLKLVSCMKVLYDFSPMELITC